MRTGGALVQAGKAALMGGAQGATEGARYGEGGEGALRGAGEGAVTAGVLAGLGGYAGPGAAVANRAPMAAALLSGGYRTATAKNDADRAEGFSTLALPGFGAFLSRPAAGAERHTALGNEARSQLLARPDPSLRPVITAEAARLRAVNGEMARQQKSFDQPPASPLPTDAELEASARGLWAQQHGEAHTRTAKLQADVANKIIPHDPLFDEVHAHAAKMLAERTPEAVAGVRRGMDIGYEKWLIEQVAKLRAADNAERAARAATAVQRPPPDRAAAEALVGAKRVLTPEDRVRLEAFVRNAGGNPDGASDHDLGRGVVPPSESRADHLITAAKPGVERVIEAKSKNLPGERSIIGQHVRDALNPLEFAMRGPLARFARAESPVGLRQFDATKASIDPELRGAYADPAAKAAVERAIAEGFRAGPLKMSPSPGAVRNANAGLAATQIARLEAWAAAEEKKKEDAIEEEEAP